VVTGLKEAINRLRGVGLVAHVFCFQGNVLFCCRSGLVVLGKYETRFEACSIRTTDSNILSRDASRTKMDGVAIPAWVV